MLSEHSLPPDEWCKMLGTLELGLNSAAAESTGIPPALGAFGELPRLPVDVVTGAGAHVGAHEVAEQVKTLVEEAKRNLVRAQEYQKRYYDAHHRQVEFDVGDRVLLSTKNLRLPGTRKFHPRWVGPFVVLQRIGATAYRLDLGGRFSALHDVFHVSYLKPHVAGGASGAPPEPVELDGQLEYEVAGIKAHRRRGRRM